KDVREGLFATDIRPRALTKAAVVKMAYQVLERHGYGEDDYYPPTPIELLVEREEGIAYGIAPLPSGNGAPMVLGRTRWNGKVREITINSELADSGKE